MEDAIPVNVSDIIDRVPVGALQIRVIALCFLTSMLDGFDTQSIAFVAPSIRDIWQLLPSQFGSIFSATLFGTALGALLFGRLADRYGRRIPMAIAVLMFGILTLACVWSVGFRSLMALRFLAGIGLGGAIPNLMAYVSEYAPRRARSTIVVATIWGYPAGAILGGLISTHLIPAYGWQSVFYAGGVLPLCLAPLLLSLPESIGFLTQRGNSRSAVGDILRKIDHSHVPTATMRYFLPEPPVSSQRIGAVFTGRLAAGTVLLGGALSMSLLLAYLLVNWIPLLFRQMGLPLKDAVFGTVMLNLSGILGSYFFSRRLDRGRRALLIMVAGYAIAALAVASIGVFGSARLGVMISTACAGFFLIGPQLSLTAYIANYYPTALRATGIGVTQAFGRGGSLLGPLLGGALLSLGMTSQRLFQWGAIPALLTMTALLTLYTIESRRLRLEV